MSTTVTVLYFASLAEQLGTRSETLELPPAINTPAALQQHIAGRGGPWQSVAGEQTRIAVNQTLCKPSASIQAGDEIAFFPPVTGG